MGDYVIHAVPGSPYARAAMVALEEKRLPYRFAAMRPGMLRSPEYLARHPFAKMPAFEHGDFQLYETQAIVRYIDRVAPAPALSPADARQLARMDQIMNICDHYLFRGVANVVIFQRVVGPRVMGTTPDEAAIAQVIPDGERVFGVLAGLLGKQAYFAGDALSLADVMLGPQIALFEDVPEWQALVAPHANLVAWMARMNSRPGMQATTWEKTVAMAAG